MPPQFLTRSFPFPLSFQHFLHFSLCSLIKVFLRLPSFLLPTLGNFILCECSLNHFEQENRYWSPSRLSIPKITLKRFLVLEISVDYNAVLSFHGASFWRDNKAIKHGNERKPSTQSRGEPLLLCRNSYLSM